MAQQRRQSRFKRAVRKTVPIRLLVMGRSGKGKTAGGLSIAHHLAEIRHRELGWGNGRVAVVDSEVTGEGDAAQGSATKYAGEWCLCQKCRGHGLRFDFDTIELDLQHTHPNDYTEAMEDAAYAGYSVLLVDSITHGWQAILREVDRSKARNSKADPWLKATPMYEQWVQRILTWPRDVICTVRTKEKFDRKNDFASRGDVPVFRDGIEYEFDLSAYMATPDLSIVKARAFALQDRSYRMPGEGFARDLVDWSVAGNPGDEEEQRQSTDRMPVYRRPDAGNGGAREEEPPQPASEEEAPHARDPHIDCKHASATPRGLGVLVCDHCGTELEEEAPPPEALPGEAPAVEPEQNEESSMEEATKLQLRCQTGIMHMEPPKRKQAEAYLAQAWPDTDKLTKLATWIEERAVEPAQRDGPGGEAT